MTLAHEMKCWEIMGCEKKDSCLVKNFPDDPCWETALRSTGYKQSAMVCRDCLVFLVKQQSPVLSEEEVEEILKVKSSGHGSIPCPNLEFAD